MVKRKRLPSAPGSEERIQDGLTVDGLCSEREIHYVERVAGGPNVTDVVATGGSCATRSASRLLKPSYQIINENTDQNTSAVSLGKEDIVENIVKKVATCSTGPILRSSARVQKRPRDSSPSITNKPTKKNGTVSSKPGNSAEQGKARRPWELWSVDDKNTFFEALCEYGKDFENIQNYIVQKNRKKGHPPQMIKNKDQVRHFYYRTWHKISKHLNISDDIKKQAQELYGLINYGELRKKIGGRLDEKNGQKLNELVHKGATTIRCKGKNLRIKTPVCRAIKNLNDVEDPKDEEVPKLPARIRLELRPRSNHSWAQVQSIAQNPRVRLNVSLQQRVSSIISYFQERWRTSSNKQRDQLQKSSMDTEQLHTEEMSPLLRLMPRKCDSINLVSVTTNTEVSSASISLQNYRRKVQCLGDSGDATMPTCYKKSMKGKAKSAVVTIEDQKKNNAEEKNSTSVKVVSEPNTEISSQQLSTVKLNVLTPQRHENGDNIKHQSSPLADEHKSLLNCDEGDSVPAHEITLRQLLALETAVNPVSQVDAVLFNRTPSFLCDSQTATEQNESEVKDSNGLYNSCEEREICVPMDSCIVQVPGQTEIPKPSIQEQLDKVKHGWLLKECGTLTVGEVYLMLGNPETIILEYEWELPSSKKHSTVCPEKSPIQKLATILGRLLQTASATLTDLNKTKQERQGMQTLQACRCGHHCCSGPVSKSSISKTSSIIRSPTGNRGSSKANKVTVTKITSTVNDAVSSTTSTAVPRSIDGGTTILQQTELFRKPILNSTHNQVVISNKSQTLSSPIEKLVPCDKALKEQLDKYTQHRKAKGRMKKSVFIQRELPLLPKTGPTHSMMTLRIVPTASQLAGSFMPVLSNSALAQGSLPHVNSMSKMVRVMHAPTSNVATLIGSSLGTSQMASPVMTTPELTIPKITTSTPIRTAGTSTLAAASPSTTTTSMPCTMLISTTATVTIPLSTTMSSTIFNPLLTSTNVASTVPVIAEEIIGSSSIAANTNPIPQLEYSLTSVPKVAEPNCTISTNVPPMQSVRIPKPNNISAPASTSVTTALKSKLPDISVADLSTSKLSVTPPSISSLLEMSLPGPDGADGVNLVSDVSTDKLLDITLGNSNSDFSGLINLAAVSSSSKCRQGDEVGSLTIPPLSTENELEHQPSTPVTSPTNSLFKISSPGLEGHWLNGDVSEFSLSNFLSHLESPVKVSSSLPASSNTQGESTSDMDPNFQCILNENCIDYTSKFEDFAAQMTAEGGHKKSA